MLTITIDLYDCTLNTSLSADEMAERYISAARQACPGATIRTVCDGKGTRVHSEEYDPNEWKAESAVCDAIGAAWVKACEDHPHTEEDARR